jgi:hypothetical protein
MCRWEVAPRHVELVRGREVVEVGSGGGDDDDDDIRAVMYSGSARKCSRFTIFRVSRAIAPRYW